MIYISDHLNWQIKQYSIWSNVNPVNINKNPVTSVYTYVKKYYGSQYYGYPSQNWMHII